MAKVQTYSSLNKPQESKNHTDLLNKGFYTDLIFRLCSKAPVLYSAHTFKSPKLITQSLTYTSKEFIINHKLNSLTSHYSLSGEFIPSDNPDVALKGEIVGFLGDYTSFTGLLSLDYTCPILRLKVALTDGPVIKTAFVVPIVQGLGIGLEGKINLVNYQRIWSSSVYYIEDEYRVYAKHSTNGENELSAHYSYNTNWELAGALNLTQSTYKVGALYSRSNFSFKTAFNDKGETRVSITKTWTSHFSSTLAYSYDKGFGFKLRLS